MWRVEENMEAFKALSFGEKWRVRGFLIRGSAPDDPRLALAAVELADGYQRQELASWMRWLPGMLVALASAGFILNALDGDLLGMILNGLTALAAAAQYLLNPATRPKNVARAAEASRRVADAGYRSPVSAPGS